MRVYLAVLLLLAGCATPEQRAERVIARYGSMCEKLGFQPDTDQWRNCLIQQQSIAAQERTAAAGRANAGATAAGNAQRAVK